MCEIPQISSKTKLKNKLKKKKNKLKDNRGLEVEWNIKRGTQNIPQELTGKPC